MTSLNKLLKRAPRSLVAWLFVLWTVSTTLLWVEMHSTARIEPGWFHLWYALPIVLPASIILLAVNRQFGLSSPLGSSLAFMLAVGVSWALGNVVWFYYQTCASWALLQCDKSIVVPYPSAADLLYVATYPLLIAAALRMAVVIGVHRRQSWAYVVMALCIGVPTFYIGVPSTHILGVPIGHAFWIHPGAGLTTIWLTSLYMIGDIVLISMAVGLLMQARKVAGGMFVRPLVLFLAGIVSLYIGDLLYFRETATDSYTDDGTSSFVYAIVLVLLPYAVHRFTLLPRLIAQRAQPTGRDACHEAAHAIVAAQTRVLGPLAGQIAEATPGLRVRDAELILALPYEQSLLALASAYGDRTGHFGRQLSREAVREVAAARPAGDLDAVLRELDNVESRRVNVPYLERPLVIVTWT
ncbi:MAG: hypothetical protein H7123_04920, partial [Thermoleophilia bacterium]|nr:hypothetical protein [Thermoleophilia bacterium]